MPYFSTYMEGPVHGIFATDSLGTSNVKSDDQGLEAMVDSEGHLKYININTGEISSDLPGLRQPDQWGATKAHGTRVPKQSLKYR